MKPVSESDFKAVTPLAENKGKAAVIWAEDELGRCLLQIRDNFDFVKMGGRLCLFGGHVEDGENLADAALREFEEETGIRVSLDELEPKIAFVSPTNDQMLHFVFKLNRRIQVTDIVVHEGAGFVFLERSQFDDFPLLPAVILADQHLGNGALGT